MATKKSVTTKKAAVAKKAAPVKKAASSKKAAPKKKTAPKKAVSKLARKAALAAPSTGQSVVVCRPGRRCKKQDNGDFICQRRTGGRWEQVGARVFPTMQACLSACCPDEA